MHKVTYKDDALEAREEEVNVELMGGGLIVFG
jgi:hypothetical protein